MSVRCVSTFPLSKRCAVTRSTKTDRDTSLEMDDSTTCVRKTSWAIRATASAYHAGSDQ